MKYRAGQWIKEFFYPAKCLGCGSYLDTDASDPNPLQDSFCAGCLDAGFHPIREPYCTRCGIPFPKSHPENHVCGSCLTSPMKIETLRAACEYKGVVRQAVPLFKYQSRLSLADVFGQLMFKTFTDCWGPEHSDRIDLLMPVPLHLSRLRKRGFNQAYLLMRRFRKLYKKEFGSLPRWQTDIHSLVREKKTLSQTGFDLAERKKNLRGAFAVTDRNRIKGRSILLVDDVATTGSTLNEAAVVLMKNGASKVQALVLARA